MLCSCYLLPRAIQFAMHAVQFAMHAVQFAICCHIPCSLLFVAAYCIACPLLPLLQPTIIWGKFGAVKTALVERHSAKVVHFVKQV